MRVLLSREREERPCLGAVCKLLTFPYLMATRGGKTRKGGCHGAAERSPAQTSSKLPLLASETPLKEALTEKEGKVLSLWPPGTCGGSAVSPRAQAPGRSPVETEVPQQCPLGRLGGTRQG